MQDSNDRWVVCCLCARWCGTCRDYEATYSQLRDTHGTRFNFVWIDIEEHDELLDDVGVDIETFPTWLIARGDEPVFFGSVTPHAQTIARLIEAALAGDLQVITNGPAPGLARRLAATAA